MSLVMILSHLGILYMYAIRGGHKSHVLLPRQQSKNQNSNYIAVPHRRDESGQRNKGPKPLWSTVQQSNGI